MTPPTDTDVDSSVAEIEFLARSPHRVGVLDALADGPRDRRELRTLTGASPPTMSRVLADFEERRWLARDGSTYELTALGEFVADRFASLREAMATERRLRDVWKWLPREMEGFSVDLFADAVVTTPGPGYPSRPVERIAGLLGDADSMRGFGATMVKSANLEAACRSVLDGLDLEFVYEPAVLEAVVSWNPDRVAEAMACENCAAFVHDSLPDGDRCGVDVYDDRVAICCHDGATGALQAVVDTDAEAAVAWAESVYERVRREARPLEAVEGLPAPDVVE